MQQTSAQQEQPWSNLEEQRSEQTPPEKESWIEKEGRAHPIIRAVGVIAFTTAGFLYSRAKYLAKSRDERRKERRKRRSKSR